MAWRLLRNLQLDPDLYGDTLYNPFTRELHSPFEDLFGLHGTAMTDEDLDSTVLFGTLRGNVVGLRYYTGVVNNNEMVALQREPNNRYDVHAIKVNNVNGEQVGHIKRELAECLANIMDNRLAFIEGVVPYGAHNAFTMPVQLSFWGMPENKQAVLNCLNMYNFKLAPPGKSLGFGRHGTSGQGGTSYSAPGHVAVQMTTEQPSLSFEKLNLNNYHLWSSKMKLYLEEKELWSVVQKDAPVPESPEHATWIKNDRKAKLMLVSTLTENEYAKVYDLSTAKQIWESLRDLHVHDSLQNKAFLLQRLISMRMSEGQNVSAHIDEMMGIIKKLSSMGKKIPDDDLCIYILNSLPPSYTSIRHVLLSQAQLSLHFLIGQIKDEFLRRNTEKSLTLESALKVSSKRELFCDVCKKRGHLASQCRFRKTKADNGGQFKQAPPASSQERHFSSAGKIKSKEETFLLSTKSNNGSIWLVDSGASSHICTERNLFKNFHLCSERVYMANGDYLEIQGKGSISLLCELPDGEIQPLNVKNCLYAPTAHANLLSVRQITKRGFEVAFFNDCCYIRSKHQLIAVANVKPDENLF